MCPICISTAALAWAGSGSAGGLATLVAVKLHLKRDSEKDRVQQSASWKPERQKQKAGGGK
ncbi:MAG TPA: hypothetical protein VF022_11470 [Rhodanobacteraceae bacterium]|jgi:hypothetical protein